VRTTKFILYAWQLSWYSAKVRPYLRFKGIDFVERLPSLATYYRTSPGTASITRCR
jgi:hypothetical protein